MKAVIFSGEGDLKVRLETDFNEASPGEQGTVRLHAHGMDVETGEEPFEAAVYGWFSPAEAREIAKYLNEMADRAEAGAA
ncbi:hypothetical protein [Deinococcus soli (ex Cha et al. 2016)]|uniref:hypothetical protein n=1 Tax=Deinococcus soli (ex Cha et al. 2016) TaxID=1309411 RepID=UPI00166F5A1C|nr:hypothetical protein [Deinococcus soli (ex Cha et al. 2016)]GGB71613.1 hypothetical protein GCM10008019_29690 [Deinococcus soli (ex Cha et al. 2016)]